MKRCGKYREERDGRSGGGRGRYGGDPELSGMGDTRKFIGDIDRSGRNTGRSG
jgi:hypothetical protein